MRTRNIWPCDHRVSVPDEKIKKSQTSGVISKHTHAHTHTPASYCMTAGKTIEQNVYYASDRQGRGHRRSLVKFSKIRHRSRGEVCQTIAWAIWKHDTLKHNDGLSWIWKKSTVTGMNFVLFCVKRTKAKVKNTSFFFVLIITFAFTLEYAQ